VARAASGVFLIAARGGVTHPFSEAGMSLAPPSAVDWRLLRRFGSSTALVWWGGRCCRSEGVAVDAGVAWVSFLGVRLLGGHRGRRRCSGAPVEVPGARRRCSGGRAWWWRCLSILLSLVCVL
jgi:hypothetical protein